MKISYNWLKDYLPIDLEPEKVSEILTDIGLEVEGLELHEAVEGGLKGLVVGHVLEAKKHPNADKLSLTSVDVGGKKPLPIVCGAPNVAQGQKVVVAIVGTKLFPVEGEAFTIKKGKIRGEVSMGMICAEDEIGLGTNHDGIMVLPDDAKPGTPVRDLFDLKDDYVFEIGLTPNRSDATSHIGVARDLAAALYIRQQIDDFKIKTPSIQQFTEGDGSLNIPVEVADKEACPRYAGIAITGVTVKPSPAWMQERLNAIGVRPISNIVDITNFILHELGQPLHAFDADQITGGKVMVQTLPQDTTFVTLDETERKLHAEDLMICNGLGEGMCIAGVFGGLTSGVSDETHNIFLESACFHPTRTRRTATRHNLRTDAAQRFEKGVDPNGVVFALKRAALLIAELGGGKIASPVVDVYPKQMQRARIGVQYAHINRLAGIVISPDEVRRILTALEFGIAEESPAGLTVLPGTNRTDVLREADVIEEILRIYGFNNVPEPGSVQLSLTSKGGLNEEATRNAISDYLAASGFNEIMGTSITNSTYYENDKDDLVFLLKSMNANMDVLRKNMLFSGLEAVAYNQNRQQNDLRLFEFGKTYRLLPEGKGLKRYEEIAHLSLLLTGTHKAESWREPQRKLNFFDVKQKVGDLFNRMGLKYKTDALENDVHLMYGLKYLCNNKTVAKLGVVKPSTCKKFGVKQEVLFADFDWDAIVKLLGKQKMIYAEVPRFPSVRRDLALLLDESVNFGQLSEIVQQTSKRLLQSVNLFDIFEDKAKIGEGKKSYAISMVFQDERKTLTDKEVEKIMQKLTRRLQSELGALVR